MLESSVYSRNPSATPLTTANRECASATSKLKSTPSSQLWPSSYTLSELRFRELNLQHPNPNRQFHLRPHQLRRTIIISNTKPLIQLRRNMLVRLYMARQVLRFQITLAVTLPRVTAMAHLLLMGLHLRKIITERRCPRLRIIPQTSLTAHLR